MTATEKHNSKLMRAAGFHIIDYEYGVWGRGCLRIAVGYDRKISIDRLIQYVIESSFYWARRDAKIIYEERKVAN